MAKLNYKVQATVNVPCHPRRTWRLIAWSDIPREEYERHCPECGKRWEIEKTRLVANADMIANSFEFTQLNCGE